MHARKLWLAGVAEGFVYARIRDVVSSIGDLLKLGSATLKGWTYPDSPDGLGLEETLAFGPVT
jgi:hypothetical protein